jgi:hypothetical protein
MGIDIYRAPERVLLRELLLVPFTYASLWLGASSVPFPWLVNAFLERMPGHATGPAAAIASALWLACLVVGVWAVFFGMSALEIRAITHDVEVERRGQLPQDWPFLQNAVYGIGAAFAATAAVIASCQSTDAVEALIAFASLVLYIPTAVGATSTRSHPQGTPWSCLAMTALVERALCIVFILFILLCVGASANDMLRRKSAVAFRFIRALDGVGDFRRSSLLLCLGGTVLLVPTVLRYFELYWGHAARWTLFRANTSGNVDEL